jgi:hypothetical protein
VIFDKLPSLLARLESDDSLFAPAQLRQRIELLDELDAHFGGDTDATLLLPSTDAALLERAATLRRRVETANYEVCGRIREDIRQGIPDSLRTWINLCSSAPDDAAPGLGYDHLDELIAGVLQIRDPEDEVAHPGPEQVFYQPTPIRHALVMFDRSGLSAADVLVDFGSGLGQLSIVASILTGARALGIELEHAYVERASECARNLRLDSVTFLQADAREADLSSGTVFHLYTPFTGSILRTVLNRLEQESQNRPITICTLGPCAGAVAQETWLRSDRKLDADWVTVFRS